MKLLVSCPAKVNLFLAVGPPDRRGYHPLRTIFQAIDLCDALEVTFGEGGVRLEVAGAELPADNTVTRALRLSREIFVQQPSLIRLEKRIPMQSGLGGGSSDAAGLLRALQAASGDASQAELASVACGVGADVPFFLSGGRARGEGYGDVITALPDPAEEWYVIAKPEIGCSTPEMYALLDGESREWRDWPLNDNLYNDFERVAPRECIDLIERMLTAGARDAALSGSGSSVFGRFATHATARDAEERLRGDDVNQVWVAKSLTRSESLDIKRSL